jgi:hypothetical protein
LLLRIRSGGQPFKNFTPVLGHFELAEKSSRQLNAIEAERLPGRFERIPWKIAVRHFGSSPPKTTSQHAIGIDRVRFSSLKKFWRSKPSEARSRYSTSAKYDGSIHLVLVF